MKSLLYNILIILSALLLYSCTDNQSIQITMENDSALVMIDDTTVKELIVYYPQFKSIDLVCEKMPSQQDTNVIFCAEAAFTHELLDKFTHSNIDGDHVSGGKRYKGAHCEDNSGAFAWFCDSSWIFINGEYDELLDSVASSGGMGFGQAIIIHDHETIRPLWRDGVNKYRALCEKDGKICIVDSRNKVSYEKFVALLETFAPTHALYLDMGAGWNHSWWRDGNGKVHIIHPTAKNSRYCTNCITFYR